MWGYIVFTLVAVSITVAGAIGPAIHVHRGYMTATWSEVNVPSLLALFLAFALLTIGVPELFFLFLVTAVFCALIWD